MFLTLFQGIIIGICNIIPGVSGGTMIAAFGLYERFIELTSLNMKNIAKNWKFHLPFVIGLGAGIVFFSKGINFLFMHFPNQTSFFFTGLIAGSIPLIMSLTFNKEQEKSCSSIQSLFLTFAGVFVMIGFIVLKKYFGSQTARLMELPAVSLFLLVKMTLAGIIGALAMIIPGISGSLLLLMIGAYPVIICAIPAVFVSNTCLQAVLILAPVGFGVLIGLIFGSFLLKTLIEKYPVYAYSVILGLVIGSIFSVYPGFYGLSTKAIICSLLCLAFGAAVSFISSKLSKDKNHDENE